jgi:pimeloyl-ACP methyl ester carboxylesterase
MIPGTLCDERIFIHQKKHLSQTHDVHVINYDRLKKIKDWPIQMLKTLPQEFSLLGFSLGGIWALELLRLEPQRVKRLALVASNAEPANRRIRSRSKKMMRNWMSGGPENALKTAETDYFHHPVKFRAYYSLLLDMAKKTPNGVAMNSFLWAASRPCSKPVVSSYDQPFFLISGAQDRVCPRTLQKNMSTLNPNAKWIEIPRCGHMIPLEKPKALNQVLKHWLSTPSREIQH